MAKILAWVIVILVVMLALRIANLRKARARRARESGRAAATRGAEAMVRCVRCGVYLPRAEAKPVRGGLACAAGECASHA